MAESSLKEQITEDMKSAMRAKDSARLGTIRLILAALKQKEVDERKDLSDADILSILEKLIKQRRESVAQYEKANRQDLVDQENFEIGIIQEYMPAAMSEAEIDTAISQAIAQTGASSIKDMGKVVGVLKPQLTGRADMAAVSAKVKAKLG